MYLIGVARESVESKLNVIKTLPLIKSQCPGFFSPLTDRYDVRNAAIAPLTDSLSFGVVAALLLVGSAESMLGGVQLAARSMVALYYNDYQGHRALTNDAVKAVGNALGGVFDAIGFALLAILTVPVLAIHTLTRVTATLVSLTANGFMALVDSYSASHRQADGVPLDATRYV